MENNRNVNFCPNCGTALKCVGQFCHVCGARVRKSSGTVPQTVTVNQGTAAAAEPPKPQGGAAVKIDPAKLKKLIPVIAGALALTLAVIILIICLNSCGGSVTVSDFEVDERYFIRGTEDEAVFTVAVEGKAKSVCLYGSNDRQIGTMNDRGIDGDRTSGDGIYSCTVEIGEDFSRKDSFGFYCSADKVSSEELTIYFFETPTEDEAEEAETTFKNVRQDIYDIEADYADSEGYVSPDDADEVVKKIEKYLKNETSDDDILLYEIEGNYVYIKFTSGLTLVYEPMLEGVKAGGDDASLTYITYEPHADIANGEYKAMTDALAREFDSTSEYYGNENVTLEQVKNISSDQFILWSGHGGYGPIIKSFLGTGESFSWDDWWWDVGYYWDCVQDRVLCRGDDNACITYKFVEHYCDDIDNSIIVLSSCYSAKDSKLAQAFLDNGATAVMGFDNTVYSGYADGLTIDAIESMYRSYNPATNSYYTLKDAIDKQMTVYGSNDVEWANMHPEIFVKNPIKSSDEAAAPVIFGGEAAENFVLVDEVRYGTMSGKVCEAADPDEPVSGAEVKLYIEGVLYTTVETDSDGSYSLEVPRSSYEVKISADGYMEFVSYAYVSADTTTYLETFLMIEGDESESGTAEGTVFNSLSGNGEGNVNIEFKKGWNSANKETDTVGSTTADSDGDYSIELPFGNYTAVVTKDGFSRGSFNIIVQRGTTRDQNGMITPEINGNDYLITLTWGKNPDDLDSHLFGELTNGNYFHVYYHDKSERDDGSKVCELDYDDTSSYGPEHITLSAKTDAPYYYFVHRYSGSGSLASSGAKVTVEQGNVVIAQFNVPTSLGSGDYWNVFAIKDGNLVVENSITNDADLYYAD